MSSPFQAQLFRRGVSAVKLGVKGYRQRDKCWIRCAEDRSLFIGFDVRGIGHYLRAKATRVSFGRLRS